MISLTITSVCEHDLFRPNCAKGMQFFFSIKQALRVAWGQRGVVSSNVVLLQRPFDWSWMIDLIGCLTSTVEDEKL
jgi:hypothetical protein